MSSETMRRRLVYLPLAAAAMLILPLLLFRNQISRPLLENGLDRYLDTRFSRPVAVSLGRLCGDWLTRLTLEGIELRYEESDALIFSADEISAGYRLATLLGPTPFAGVEYLRATGVQVVSPFPELRPRIDPLTVDELTRKEVDPENPIASTLRIFPHSMRLDLDLTWRMEPIDELRPRLRLEVHGSGEKGIDGELALFDAGPEDASTTGKNGGLRTAFRLFTRPEGIEIDERSDSVPGTGGGGFSILGSVELAADRRSLERIALEIRGVPGTLTVNAGDAEIDLRGSLAGGGELPEQAAALISRRGPRAAPGRFELRIDGTRRSGEERALAELLVSRPRDLLAAAEFRAELSGGGWSVEDLTGIAFEARGSFSSEKVEVAALQLETGGGILLSGSGGWVERKAERQPGRFSIADLRIAVPSIASLSGLIPAAADSGISGGAEARLQLAGTFPVEDPIALLRSLSGRVNVEGRDLTFGSVALPVAQLRGRFADGGFDIGDLTVSTGDLRLTATGRLEPDPRLPSLTLKQLLLFSNSLNDERIELEQTAEISLVSGGVDLSGVLLDLAGGRLSLNGELRRRRLALNAEGRGFSAGRIARLLGAEAPVDGELDWQLRLDGDLEEPRFSFYAESGKLTLGDQPVELLIGLSQSGEGLRLDQARLQIGNDIELSGRGTLPFLIRPEGADFSAAAPSTLLGIDYRFSDILARFPAASALDSLPVLRVDGSLRLEKREGRLRFAIGAEGRDLLSADDAGEADRFSNMNFDLTVEGEGDGLAGVDGGLVVDGERLIRLDGTVGLTRGRERQIPALEDLRLDLRTGIELPLDYLAAYLPPVVYSIGFIDGEVRIGGRGNAPELEGTLDLRGAEIHPAGSLPALTALRGGLDFGNDGVLRIGGISGELGRAPFRLAGSAPLFSGEGSSGGASGEEFDLTLRGENLLLFSDPDLRVRSDLDLRLSGPPEAPRISGLVDQVRADYSRDIPLLASGGPPAVDREALQLFSVDGEGAARTELAVDIRADRTLTVENNLFSGDFSADLALSGTLQVPVLTGRVFLEEAALALPVTTVDINRLLIEFPPESPFNPELQLRGQSRVSGYDLFVQASGQVPSIEIEVSSNPPLPGDQALLLLTTGYADLAGVQAGDRTVRSLGTFFGRQLIEVLFGRDDADNVLLDRVDVAVGRQLTVSGSEVIQVEFQLDQEDAWFLQFERDRYDQYNVGVAWRFWFN